MPMVQLFNKKKIEKLENIDQNHTKTKVDAPDSFKVTWQTGLATQSYQDIEQLPAINSQLIASQIMTLQVITLNQNDSIIDAIKLFKEKKLRHIPITTKSGTVEGILSDRDVLHYLSGINNEYTKDNTPVKMNDNVRRLMTTEVLTASADTDVRYISRLFVEQRIGAMPIVENGNIIGLITRSDILNAVMKNFILELWV